VLPECVCLAGAYGLLLTLSTSTVSITADMRCQSKYVLDNKHMFTCVQDLEWALDGRRAPSDSGAAPAFAQGKQILVSIIKRYKRRLTPSAAAGRGGGDAGGGSWRQQLVVLSAPLMVTSALLACVAWGWPQGTQLSLW
jgi:hypothetical protein